MAAPGPLSTPLMYLIPLRVVRLFVACPPLPRFLSPDVSSLRCFRTLPPSQSVLSGNPGGIHPPGIPPWQEVNPRIVLVYPPSLRLLSPCPTPLVTRLIWEIATVPLPQGPIASTAHRSLRES